MRTLHQPMVGSRMWQHTIRVAKTEHEQEEVQHPVVRSCPNASELLRVDVRRQQSRAARQKRQL